MHLGLYAEEGDTYLVEILGRHNHLTRIRRLATAEGYYTDEYEPEVISHPLKLVSFRQLRTLESSSLWHFASPKVHYQLKASGFVSSGRSLVSACSHGLGSGIYGLYINDPDVVKKIRHNEQQRVYLVECRHPFLIQDGDHVNSITVASMATNRYVDDLIKDLDEDMVDYSEILAYIQAHDITHLALLWWIVFVRSVRPIGQIERPGEHSSLGNDVTWLKIILAQYVWEYRTNMTLRDTISKVRIRELPINYIMRALGYDGLLGDDRVTNTWARGCICYNYLLATVLEGSDTRRRS
jgi:hypothetical protein